MPPLIGIGSALRGARTARGLSLSDVAGPAGISTATLSRIETEKQSVDVSLLVTLTRVLRVSPSEIVSDQHDTRDVEEKLVETLATISSEKRARIIAAAAKRRASRRSSESLQAQLDALLATIDVIRDELSDLQKQARRRR